MKKRDKQIIAAGFTMILLAIASAGFWVSEHRSTDPLHVDEIFAEGAKSKDFVQVSLYTLSSFKDGVLIGGGHVRYSRDGNIFGFGEGKNGATLSIMFEDIDSSSYKACAALFAKGVPFRKELFIAGNGTLSDVAANVMGNNAAIRFKTVSRCSYTALAQ